MVSSASGLEAILHAALARPTKRAARVDATVVFDAGGDLVFYARLKKGNVAFGRGRPRKPTTTISADAATLGAVVTGEKSGVQAYLEGKLRARGSLALALELDALFEHDARAPEFPKSHRVHVTLANGEELETFHLEAGKPGNPKVILLHGLGATSTSMLPTFHDLSRDHHVFAVDLPGFGESSKPLRRYHAMFYARWLERFFDARSIERAHLIGNSMGGRVALEAALRTPERVDRLALLAPSLAFRKYRQLVPIARLLWPELALMPLPVTRLQVLLTLKGLFFKPERIARPAYDAAADEFLRVFATPRGRIAFFSAAKQIYLEDAHGVRGFWDRLPRLSRPALFLFGDRDRLVPHSFAAHVRRAVPHATIEVIEDCGHVPQFELPDETHARIRAFFAQS